MAKYNYRAVHRGQSWTAEIIRKKTAREVVVTKEKSGFNTEAAANEWGEAALKSLVADLYARRRRPEPDNN